MKMPIGRELTPSARLDVFVEPLRGFRERGDAVWLSLPHANHRDNQKDKCCQTEDITTQRAVANRADHAKQRMNNQNSNVKRQRLRRVKANLHFLAWYEE